MTSGGGGASSTSVTSNFRFRSPSEEFLRSVTDLVPDFPSLPSRSDFPSIRVREGFDSPVRLDQVQASETAFSPAAVLSGTDFAALNISHSNAFRRQEPHNRLDQT